MKSLSLGLLVQQLEYDLKFLSQHFSEDILHSLLSEAIKVRDDIDDSIWEAEYMQNPIEAKGLLFPKSKLMRFKAEHLKGEPDGVIGACDVADKGDDDLCAPIGPVYGDRVFITNVTFTKDPVEVTEPLLAQAIIETKCDRMRVESNNGGRIFGKNIRALVVKEKGKCEIQTRPTTQNKDTRILMKSGWIKKHCCFLEESEYEKGSDYDRFMKSPYPVQKRGWKQTRRCTRRNDNFS